MPEQVSWMDDLAIRVDQVATAMYWPWAICLLFAVGLFYSFRSGFAQVRRFASPHDDGRLAASRRGRRHLAVSGLHDGLRLDDRRQQHRGRFGRHHHRRAGRPLLDLVLRLLRHGRQDSAKLPSV